MADHDHDHDHDHEHDDEAMELALDTQSHIFLELRKQNIELLKIATQIVGYGGGHSPLKGDDAKQAVERIWNTYSELYEWIDPESTEEEE